MRFVLYRSPDKQLDAALAAAFANGIEVCGHHCQIVDDTYDNMPVGGCDVAVVIGVKGKSKQIINDYHTFGCKTIYIDKGYIRIRDRRTALKVLYFKVSLGGFQPLDYLMLDEHPSNRWKAISKKHGIKYRNRKDNGSIITFSGPSAKNAIFHDLGTPTEYASKIAVMVAKHSQKPLYYWPKQSWKGAEPVEGAVFARPPEYSLGGLINKSHLFIVHNSNSCVEAMLHGVPVFSTGPSIAVPVSENDPHKLDNPFFPDEQLRKQWLYNVCHWQWTLEEMYKGTTMKFLEKYIRM